MRFNRKAIVIRKHFSIWKFDIKIRKWHTIYHAEHVTGHEMWCEEKTHFKIIMISKKPMNNGTLGSSSIISVLFCIWSFTLNFNSMQPTVFRGLEWHFYFSFLIICFYRWALFGNYMYSMTYDVRINIDFSFWIIHSFSQLWSWKLFMKQTVKCRRSEL